MDGCEVTNLAGEARFVSAVAKRLAQLGAMTRGDRHSGQGTLRMCRNSKTNLSNKRIVK